MEMLDRYLYEVKKYIAKKERDHILHEIKNVVSEMVDEKTGQGTEKSEALKETLIEMGPPLELARKYNSRLGYVIGPKLFKLYKMVVGFSILGISIGLATPFIVQLSFHPEISLGISVLEFLGQLLTAALNAVGAVTIVFYLIQKFISEDKLDNEKWDPEQLPDLPKKVENVNEAVGIISIAVLIGIMILFNFYPNKIGVFYSVNGGPLVFEPLLSIENIRPYLMILDPLWVSAIAVNIYILVIGKKTFISKILTAIISFGITAAFWSMLGDTAIIESAGGWAVPFASSLRMGLAVVCIVILADTVRYIVQYKRL